MDILFSIFKGLVILGVNISFGYLISYCLHFYLFYPRDVYFFNKYHFYFSPGLIFRKKKKLISYMHSKVAEYLTCVKEDYFHKNFLTEYEEMFYKEAYDYLKRSLDLDWLPKLIKEKLEYLLSHLVWTVILKLTRTIIPELIQEYNIDQKIDKLDMILDVYKLRTLFEEHFYRYMLYFNLFFFSVVGVLNMIMFFLLSP